MIRRHCPKSFLCVPRYHGNPFQNLNTNLCLLPGFSLILPPAPPGPHISFQPVWWPSLMLPCLCHHSSGVCLTLPLTLPAKWHFANRFLRLIPWFCKCSTKTHTLCKLASENTETNYKMSMQTHVQLVIHLCAFANPQQHTSCHIKLIYSAEAGTLSTCWQSAAKEHQSFSCKASSSSII